MSQENVRTVHRFLRALDRRDYENARPCLCRDAEWHNTAAFPGSRTIVGPQAIVDFWQALVESFDPAEGGMEVENVTESGDLVVIGLRSRGHGVTSVARYRAACVEPRLEPAARHGALRPALRVALATYIDANPARTAAAALVVVLATTAPHKGSRTASLWS